MAGVAVDASGDVVASGSFDQTINLGGANLVPTGGQGNMFLVKYSSTGVHAWSRAIAGAGGAPVIADADRNIVIAPPATSSVDFGGGALRGDEADVTLAKLNASGEYLWAKRFLGNDMHQVGALVIDSRDSSIVFAGYQRGSVDYGQGPVVSAGDTDVFVAKFAP